MRRIVELPCRRRRCLASRVCLLNRIASHGAMRQTIHKTNTKLCVHFIYYCVCVLCAVCRIVKRINNVARVVCWRRRRRRRRLSSPSSSTRSNRKCAVRCTLYFIAGTHILKLARDLMMQCNCTNVIPIGSDPRSARTHA